MEDKVIKELIDNGTIKFYSRFVDDTLLLIKEKDVELVKAEFEKFDKNLKFTYDMFEDKNPHILRHRNYTFWSKNLQKEHIHRSLH